MKHLTLLLAGLLFGLGLVISGMVNPEKVLNFLDVTGTWDPSLAFVMAGAVAVNFIGHRLVLRRPSPFFAQKFAIPARKDIDSTLVIGAALFGLGWGLVGLCPGPAIASLAIEPAAGFLFVTAMIAGMAITKKVTLQADQNGTLKVPHD